MGTYHGVAISERIDLLGGRYELGTPIGQGGMAVVHEGRDRRLDRPVAVKVLRPEFAHEPLLRRRFESEAQLAARLAHPNVVSVFDTGEEDGHAFIVMERLSGRTLYDQMAAGPLPTTVVRQLAAQMLAALQTAHQAGIVHRDIKPGNILAGHADEWKLGDFGIAKAAEMPRSGDDTATGLLIGTPAYLAPERLSGGEATVATDLYALGVVLYEALAGRKPVESPSPHGWAAETGAPNPLPIRTVRPDVAPDLAAVVDRALSADPAQRFASAAEMASALSGPASWDDVPPAAAGSPTHAPPTAVLAPQGGLHAGHGSGADAVITFGRRHRSSAAALVVALVVAFVLLISLVGHHSSSSKPNTSPTTSSATTPTSGSLPPNLDHALRNLEKQVRP